MSNKLTNKRDWKSDPLDVDYLIDSGLLFEMNRSVLHLFGIALTVRVDEQGKKSWGFKDMRATPEKLVFDATTMELGTTKLRRFMDEFGAGQDDRRVKKLGRGVQTHQIKEVKK